MKSIFITGTDTGIGKTFISVLLMQLLNAHKFKTFGIKPIASGCTVDVNGNLVNDDALALQYAATITRDYSVVNPIALKEAIAPHIAARYDKIALTAELVSTKLSHSIQAAADINIIEGVGGWLVPLNDKELLADVICALHIPVALVVGVKLGCLNHAILTAKMIKASQVPFIGWVANCIDPDMAAAQENIAALKRWIPSPYLGTVPYGASPTPDFIDMKHIIDCG